MQLVVAFLSMLLCVRALRANVRNSQALERFPLTAMNIRLAERRRQSRHWLALTILQNGINIYSAVCMMNPTHVVEGAADVDYTFATSVFLTFFNTTRFLEFFPDFYVLISTVGGALPSVLRFMLGCVPLYMGFAALGTILFGGRSANFGSVRASVVTLFSLLNGDSMLDIFRELHTEDFNGVVADIYLFIFCCLYIYCTVNVFISIVAGSYGRLQDLKHEQQLAQGTISRVASSQRGSLFDASATSREAGAARASSMRQSVAVRFGNASLNLLGSFVNSLAEEDELGLEAHMGRDHDDRPLSSMTELIVEERRIVCEARQELAQVLVRMDAQIAALDARRLREEEQEVQRREEADGPP